VRATFGTHLWARPHRKVPGRGFQLPLPAGAGRPDACVRPDLAKDLRGRD